jgi:hypothetical protein
MAAVEIFYADLKAQCHSRSVWRFSAVTIPLKKIYGTQYHQTVDYGSTVVLSGFFQFLTISKMVICSMYII